MKGYYIKDEPLTPEAASEIIRLLNCIQINAASAPAFLSLVASLQRIVDGVDYACPKGEPPA